MIMVIGHRSRSTIVPAQTCARRQALFPVPITIHPSELLGPDPVVLCVRMPLSARPVYPFLPKSKRIHGDVVRKHHEPVPLPDQVQAQPARLAREPHGYVGAARHDG